MYGIAIHAHVKNYQLTMMHGTWLLCILLYTARAAAELGLGEDQIEKGQKAHLFKFALYNDIVM